MTTEKGHPLLKGKVEFKVKVVAAERWDVWKYSVGQGESLILRRGMRENERMCSYICNECVYILEVEIMRAMVGPGREGVGAGEFKDLGY